MRKILIPSSLLAAMSLAVALVATSAPIRGPVAPSQGARPANPCAPVSSSAKKVANPCAVPVNPCAVPSASN